MVDSKRREKKPRERGCDSRALTELENVQQCFDDTRLID